MGSEARDRCEATLDAIDDVVGTRVRGAMYYDGDDYGEVYFRDDVDAAYTEEEKADAIEDFSLEAFGDPARLEDIYRMGELEATVRWFEEAFFVHVMLSDRSGFSISFDREAVSALDHVLRACESVR